MSPALDRTANLCRQYPASQSMTAGVSSRPPPRLDKQLRKWTNGWMVSNLSYNQLGWEEVGGGMWQNKMLISAHLKVALPPFM